jgi:hypothetical protein
VYCPEWKTWSVMTGEGHDQVWFDLGLVKEFE